MEALEPEHKKALIMRIKKQKGVELSNDPNDYFIEMLGPTDANTGKVEASGFKSWSDSIVWRGQSDAGRTQPT